MSFESTAIAMNHSRAKGTARTVLFGIASHDGDGGSFPSKPTLAVYANVTEGNVGNAIKQLVALGEIRVHVNAGGYLDTPEHMRSNKYEFLLQCPPACDGSKQHRIICYLCGKSVPADRRHQGTHRHCERLSRRDVHPDVAPAAVPRGGTPVGALPDLVDEGQVPAGGIGNEGGSDSIPLGGTRYPHQVSETTPKPKQPPHTPKSISSSSERAREATPDVVDDGLRCPGRWKRDDPTTHELGRHGKCLHCAQQVVESPNGGLRELSAEVMRATPWAVAS